MATENKLDAEPLHDNAYVWLLMLGDAYMPGIITSVYSTIRNKPNADLVVMVTPDVSAKAIEIIKLYATHIYYIDYLRFASKPMKTKRQQDLYSTWIDASYTKWNCLALPYKKIILLDADTINLTNTDELFKLKTPASPFASPFAKPYGSIESHYRGPVDRSGYPAHGTAIPKQVILDTLLIGGILPVSSPIVISPSPTDFTDYIAMLKSLSSSGANPIPFGFPNCHNGFDEQSICYFYAGIKKLNWTNVHHRYICFPWKDGFLAAGDIPRAIHYFSDTKPWAAAFDAYPDITSWYKMAAAAIEARSIEPTAVRLDPTNIESAVKADDVFIKQFAANSDVLNINSYF